MPNTEALEGNRKLSIYMENSSTWILLLAQPVNVIKFYVLIFLGNYLCLDFPCCVCSTTNKDENRRACKPPKCCQVRGLFNQGRTSSQYCQKPRSKN